VPPKAGSEAPSAHISHATKGRVRFKVPSKRGNARFFTNIKDVLEKNARVAGVVIDPVTGSVLVTHNTDTDSIIKLTESNKFFTLERRRPRHVSNHLVASFKGLDNKLKSATDGELDLPTASFLTLAGVGIYEIARGNFAAPAWYTAFWYALNIFLKARPDSDKIEKELVPLGIIE
jgi:flagellar basal body P-ring protein FlgI